MNNPRESSHSKKPYFLIAALFTTLISLFSVSNGKPLPFTNPSIKSLGEVATITVNTMPDQTEFPLGAALDYAGLSIEVTDILSDTEILTEGFTFSGGDSLLLGAQTITIVYEAAQTTFQIDVTNEGTIISAALNAEQQATSYAIYIMYGIGMNAGSDYFNVFYELQEEYGFMTPEAKTYFLENRKHTISGINESGRLVTNTFNDAIGRYNYLAAKTGHAGLTADTSPDWLNADTLGPIALFGGIIAIASAIYFITKRKWSL